MPIGGWVNFPELAPGTVSQDAAKTFPGASGLQHATRSSWLTFVICFPHACTLRMEGKGVVAGEVRGCAPSQVPAQVHTNTGAWEGDVLRVLPHQPPDAPHGCPKCPPNLCKGRVLPAAHVFARTAWRPLSLLSSLMIDPC